MPHLVWRCVEERQALEPAREEEAKVVGVDVVEMTGQGQGQGQERWYAVNLTDIVKVQVGGGDGGGGNGGGGGGLVRLPPRFLPYRDFFSTPPLTRRCQMGEMRTDGTEWAVVAPPPVGRCSTAQEEDMDLVCLVNPWGKGISAYWLAVVHFHTASSPEPPLGGPHATHGLQRPPLVVCFLTEKDRQAWVGALMGVVERNQTLHIAPQEL